MYYVFIFIIIPLALYISFMILVRAMFRTLRNELHSINNTLRLGIFLREPTKINVVIRGKKKNKK